MSPNAIRKGLSVSHKVSAAVPRFVLADPVRLRHSLGLTGLWPLFHGQVFSASEVAR